jgi:ABC-type branched-subunit amino acid transport system ATPase component
VSLLSVRGLAVHFGAVHACDGVDIEVEPGELLGIVGPNGSGKTTLFRAICGDVHVTSGEVQWLGRNIAGWSTDRIARAGLVRTFQQSMVFPSVSVRENVRMAAACAREAWRDRRSASPLRRLPDDADELLEFAGIADVADDPAGALPTGLLRIIGITLGLVTKPVMFLLDEPAAGLNEDESARLAALLRRVHATGVTLVVVDHDMSFILPLCRRLIVLDCGRKLADGEPYSVCEQEEVISVYLGARFAAGKAGAAGRTS